MLEKLLMEVLLYNQSQNLLWLLRLTYQLCTSVKAILHFQLSSTPPHSFFISLTVQCVVLKGRKKLKIDKV